MISALAILILSPAWVAQESTIVPAPPPGAEITAALETAQRKNQRVLLVWGEGEHERSQKLDALLADDRDLARKLLYEYRVVRLKPESTDAYTVLAKKYGAVLEAGVPHLTVLGADGLVLANVSAQTMLERDQFDPKRLHAFLEKHQAPYKDAKAMLTAALSKAEAQQKRVFLLFETPECQVCHQLDSRMTLQEVQPLMEKEFIFCVVDLARSIGGKELLAKHSGGPEQATPWYAVIHPDGSTVVDCDDLSGQHLGCPKTEAELELWTLFLKRARQHLSDEEVTQVVTAFRKAAGAAENKPAKSKF